MSFYDDTPKGHFQTLDRLERYIETIIKKKWSRFWDRVTQIVQSSIIIFPVFIFIKIISLVLPNQSRLMDAWLLKRYFKHYFYKRGIYTTFATRPITILPGSLILSTRTTDPLLPLYHYTLFTQSVIFPVLPHLYQFKGTLMPFKLVGQLMKRVSYPDGPLSQHHAMLKILLQQGYTVIVNINPDFVDPITQNLLYIDPLIQSLINVASDTYLLHAAHFESYHTTTSDSPLISIVSCKPLKPLLNDPNKSISEENLPVFSRFFCYHKSKFKS